MMTSTSTGLQDALVLRVHHSNREWPSSTVAGPTNPKVGVPGHRPGGLGVSSVSSGGPG